MKFNLSKCAKISRIKTKNEEIICDVSFKRRNREMEARFYSYLYDIDIRCDKSKKVYLEKGLEIIDDKSELYDYILSCIKRDMNFRTIAHKGVTMDMIRNAFYEGFAIKKNDLLKACLEGRFYRVMEE